MYDGNALAKVQAMDDPEFHKDLSIRPTAFDMADTSAGSSSAMVETITLEQTQSMTEWVK